MMLVAEVMAPFFVVLKYAGAAYLVWLVVSLWRADPGGAKDAEPAGIRLRGNFLAGLLTTLENPKAILFYAGFFPVFSDMGAVSVWDLDVLLVLATLAVGGVMLGCAFLASRAARFFQSRRPRRAMNRTAGGVMVGTGALVVAKG